MDERQTGESSAGGGGRGRREDHSHEPGEPVLLEGAERILPSRFYEGLSLLITLVLDLGPPGP